MEEKEYGELLDGIFARFPSVQNAGFSGDAYKPGLDRMYQFLELLGNPHAQYRTIHVAGTNGKGSVCCMLASALAANGCKTALYTSPHILDFRERMRIVADHPSGPYDHHFDRSGEIYSLVPKEYVYDFLKRWSDTFDRLRLSFFEITTCMAFKWFADAGADVAVIEVGLGGRLDSTNVITPQLSIITSIGLDHCDLLGDTLQKIAFEKAGIIKPGVPVVIGEYNPETAPVFRAVAAERHSPLFPSEAGAPQVHLDLQGDYQKDNLRTVLTALRVLGIPVQPGNDGNGIMEAIAHTALRTGFHGRWEHLCERPLVICDIGHNAHALRYNFAQLETMMASGRYDCLTIVYAVMADKDLDSILPLMPRGARYIFTTPKGKRALPAGRILKKFLDYGAVAPEAAESAIVIDSVQEAVMAALQAASAYKNPIIYIGGSTFAVAEAKPVFQRLEANKNNPI